jgi:hypothetical protein
MNFKMILGGIVVSRHPDASTTLKARTTFERTEGRSKKHSTSLQNRVADAGPSDIGSFKVAMLR